MFLVVWLLFCGGHGLSSSSENFANIAVVHVRTGLQDFAAFILGPDHERIHRSFDVLLLLAGLVD